jgi:hypothetical protein
MFLLLSRRSVGCGLGLYKSPLYMYALKMKRYRVKSGR